MVGSKRLELSTSSVSRKRSNQLSYEPVNRQEEPVYQSSVIATMVPGSIGDPQVRNREIMLTAKFTAMTFRQEERAPSAPARLAVLEAAKPHLKPPTDRTQPSASHPEADLGRGYEPAPYCRSRLSAPAFGNAPPCSFIRRVRSRSTEARWGGWKIG